VKRLVAMHLQQLERKAIEIEEMRRALEHLASHCHGDDRPDCPIIEDLAAGLAPHAGITKRVPSARRREPPRAKARAGA
jgi:hypothetical protein